MMGTYICSDCGRRWSGFSPSWWCEICRKKHIPNMKDILDKYKKGGAE